MSDEARRERTRRYIKALGEDIDIEVERISKEPDATVALAKIVAYQTAWQRSLCTALTYLLEEDE